MSTQAKTTPLPSPNNLVETVARSPRAGESAWLDTARAGTVRVGLPWHRLPNAVRDAHTVWTVSVGSIA